MASTRGIDQACSGWRIVAWRNTEWIAGADTLCPAAVSASARLRVDLTVQVISVDAKKKENVGGFKNGGREWQPQGAPERVNVHDFINKELRRGRQGHGKAGWVSVGTGLPRPRPS